METDRPEGWNGVAAGGASAGLPPAGFLSRIASAIDVPSSSAHAESTLDAGLAPRRDWPLALSQAGRALGLRARPVDHVVHDLHGQIGARRALVSWHAELGWLALIGASRGRLTLIRAGSADEIIEPEALAARLGIDACEAEHWMQVEPEFAAASPGAPERPTPVGRLFALLRADRADLITVVVYAVFAGLMALATPIAVQQLVNSVAFGGLVQPVVVLAILLFAGLGFGALLSALQAIAVEMIQRRIFVRACADLADRIPRVDARAYEDGFGPETVNRFFDLVVVQKTGASLMLAGTSLVLQTLVGLTILSFYHPVMLGFSVLLILAIGFVTAVLGRGATHSALAESSAKYALAHWMEELARLPGPFRTRIGRDFAARRADDLAVSWVEARRRHYRVVLRQLVGSLALQVVAGTAVLGLGGALVVNGQLTMGQLVASEIIVAIVVAAVARLGKLLESYYDLLAALDKFGVLLDLPLERGDGAAPPADDGPVSLELRGVEVLPGVTAAPWAPVRARIEPGERVALRGDDGIARRRLLEAICGLRAPTGGSVLIDGEDLAGLHLESLRESIMLVREPELQEGSVLDNLRLARPDASQQHVESVLDRLGLREVIERLPDGLRAPLRASGAPLDPSARRLLALARAVIAEPRLLCVDEEIAGLDSEERQRVLDVLIAPDAPWTLIISTRCTDWLPETLRVIDLDDDEPARPRPLASSTPAEVVHAFGEEEQHAR